MPGRVENALLHVLDTEQTSHAELRVSAMHDRSPIHTFLFDSQGLLLTANKAALQFCQAGSGQLKALPSLVHCMHLPDAVMLAIISNLTCFAIPLQTEP